MPKPIAILQPSTSKTEGPRIKAELTLRILFPVLIPRASRRLCNITPLSMLTTAPTCPAAICAAVITLDCFTNILLHLLTARFLFQRKGKCVPFRNSFDGRSPFIQCLDQATPCIFSTKAVRHALCSDDSLPAMEFFHEDRIPRNSGILPDAPMWLGLQHVPSGRRPLLLSPDPHPKHR
jgi:hypothetical protein